LRRGGRGLLLLEQEDHQEVADVALQLGKYCIDEPVKSPFYSEVNHPLSLLPTKSEFRL
jgi:hypothetical protein